MEIFLITAVIFVFAVIWFLLMAFCGSFIALYLMKVNRFNLVQNWIIALVGAMVTGPLIVWVMDLSIYYIVMHFMGAILTIWIYKLVTHDFIVQEEKIDISAHYDQQNSDVYNSIGSVEQEKLKQTEKER